MPIGGGDNTSHNECSKKYKNSTSSPIVGIAQVIRPELVRPQQQQHHVANIQQAQLQASQATPVTIVTQQPPTLPQMQQQQQQGGAIGHASVIRISPASGNQFQPFHPVIVDPTHLVPLLPPSTSTAMSNGTNGTNASNANQLEPKPVTKNGINTGSVYQWHTLLPVINAAPPPATEGHHHMHQSQHGNGDPPSGTTVVANEDADMSGDDDDVFEGSNRLIFKLISVQLHYR
jgi:hypothetical protein